MALVMTLVGRKLTHKVVNCLTGNRKSTIYFLGTGLMWNSVGIQTSKPPEEQS